MPVEVNVAMGPLPENRTLIVQKLTSEDQPDPQVVQGLETMNDVFNHFKPSVNVDFDEEDGSTKNEDIGFENLQDFKPEKFIAKSEKLNDLKAQKDEFANIHSKLKSNTSLQKILNDPSQKEAFLAVLNNLITDLQDSI
jgi:predicted component of type VI protein secretion system